MVYFAFNCNCVLRSAPRICTLVGDKKLLFPIFPCPCPPATKTLVEQSARHPHVSGYFKVLAECMHLADRYGYFRGLGQWGVWPGAPPAHPLLLRQEADPHGGILLDVLLGRP